ncbi:MAG: VCBS repeat-containing protein [Phycisphaerae bacterium]|nr:VCBS repeat-containing protein [Phycisphaerae bacterium]
MSIWRGSVGLVLFLMTWLTAAPSLADSTSSPMLVFSESGDDYPKYSIWTGSFWPDEVGTRNIDNEAPWVVLKNCPTRNEYACGCLDWGNDVNLLIHNGSSWSGPTELTTNAGGYSQRAFSLAYESQSGDLLVAYWEDGSTDKICYRIWNGSTLSGESHLSLPSTSRVRWVELSPDPNTDKIVMLTLNSDYDLYAVAWSGSGWGSITTLETDTGKRNEECFAMAYETLSGDGLVVYAQDSQNNPRYRTWNGSSWSGEGQLPSVGSDQRWLRLAADPASDQILFGSLDDAGDINANVWNGSSWDSNQQLETENWMNQLRSFDIAYEAGGTEALIVYEYSDTSSLRYRTWDGASWSSEVVGPNLGEPMTTPQLVTGINPGEIFLATQDDGDDLNMILWNGSAFGTNNQIESVITNWGTPCYMVAVPAGGAAYLFTDVSATTGFGVQSTNNGDWGSGLHWGDLDADGDLDAFVTGNCSSRLCINNNAGQTFTVSTFGGGTIYRQAALLDVDNDGDLDFWCMPSYQNEKLYENNGSASFVDRGSLGFGDPNNNEGIAAADVDQDGRSDLLMFSENGNWIGFNSAGLPAVLSGTTSSSYGLNDGGDYGNGDYCSSGDVNNDGNLDFFYHYNSGKLFLSDGDGTFTQNNHGISVATGGNEKMGSAWGDYDNDGDLDLFVARYDSGYAGYLWKNLLVENSSVSFTNVTVAAGVTNASGQRGCCWGDYDNDGDLDLYVVTRSGYANVLYENQGPPNWNFVSVSEGANAPGDGHDAVFVDYDNDGDLDLAITQEDATNTLLRNGTNNTDYLKVRAIGGGACGTNKAAVGVRVELWDAAGTTFLARREIGVARGYGGTEPMWAHFGGITNTQIYTVKVHFVGGWSSQTVVPASVSTTIGGTVIQQMLTVEEAATQVVFTDVSSDTGFNVQTANDEVWGSGLHWGDLDNDGDLDAIITGDSSSRLLIYDRVGHTYSVSDFSGGSLFRQGALLDVDNDGDLDFWGSSYYDVEKLFINNGSASFTDGGSAGFSSPYINEGIAGADVNADGWCDVLNFSWDANWIGHNQGAETPAFTGTKASSYGLNDFGDYGAGGNCSSADVNNDGRLDFFHHYGGGKLFLSDGDGTYTQDNHGISVVTGLYDKMGSAWGDYDNDGDLDLFIGRYDTGWTGYLWRNDVNWTTGSGSFTNVTGPAGILDTSGQRGCCWGDYDNDGDLDLYVVTRLGNANVLYKNQGDGTFVTACAGTDAPGDGHDAVFVDYDNDGDLDLAVTQEDATNTLLRNNTDDSNYLKVRVVGLGAGATNAAAVGIRVELWDAAGTSFISRREIGVARGYGGAEPMWAHFGGVGNTNTYTVKVYFTSLPVTEPYSVAVTPASTSTVIGGTTIPQMLTVEEPQGTTIIYWREAPNRPAQGS